MTTLNGFDGFELVIEEFSSPIESYIDPFEKLPTWELALEDMPGFDLSKVCYLDPPSVEEEAFAVLNEQYMLESVGCLDSGLL